MRNLRNALKHLLLKKGFDRVTRHPSFRGATFQQMVIVRLSFSGCEISSKISNYVMMRNLAPGDLVKKAWDLCNQDWPGCSIMNVMNVLQRFVHVQSHS